MRWLVTIAFGMLAQAAGEGGPGTARPGEREPGRAVSTDIRRSGLTREARAKRSVRRDQESVNDDEDAASGSVIACGDQCTFVIRGSGEAERTRTEVILVDRKLGVPEGEIVEAYCRARYQELAKYALRDARSDALAKCRAAGRAIAARTRCDRAGPEASDGESREPPTGVLKQLRCSIDDDATPQYDWSASSAVHAGFAEKKIRWKPTSKRRAGCRTLVLRKIRVTAVARVTGVEAKGTVAITCPHQGVQQ